MSQPARGRGTGTSLHRTQDGLKPSVSLQFWGPVKRGEGVDTQHLSLGPTGWRVTAEAFPTFLAIRGYPCEQGCHDFPLLTPDRALSFYLPLRFSLRGRAAGEASDVTCPPPRPLRKCDLIAEVSYCFVPVPVPITLCLDRSGEQTWFISFLGYGHVSRGFPEMVASVRLSVTIGERLARTRAYISLCVMRDG